MPAQRNAQWLWFNMGRTPMVNVCREHEKTVLGAQEQIIRQVTHARCDPFFDHHWITSMPNLSAQEVYRAHDFLDTFDSIAQEWGDFAWHVAHHPQRAGHA